VNISSKTHVVGHDVEHSNHLGEDEDSMTVGLELDEKLVEENHLSGVHDDSSKHLSVDVRLDLGSFEEIGVIPGNDGEEGQSRRRRRRDETRIHDAFLSSMTVRREQKDQHATTKGKEARWKTDRC